MKILCLANLLNPMIPTFDDPYALSKYEAEQGLLSMAKETEMEEDYPTPFGIWAWGQR